MSALPSTVRPPLRIAPGIVLTAPDTPAMLEKALRRQIEAEVREAFNKGWAVYYSDGMASEYVRHAIMAAAICPHDADDLLDIAMLASFNEFPDLGKRWQTFFRCALGHFIDDLVDRMLEGQRVSFGPKQ
jgi:hypothetical protein